MTVTRCWPLVAAASTLLAVAADLPGQEEALPDALAGRALPLSLEPGSPGLRSLRETIGDARIVLLGEPWHGDGAAIRLKAELVEWLHRELGFDLLVFEADFYSLNRGWESVEAPDDVGEFAAANLYPFWSVTAAAEPLWDYVARQVGSDRPLDVAGIDVRHVGAISRTELPRRLDSLLAVIPEVDPELRVAFRETLERFLAEENRWTPGVTTRRRFFEALDAAAREAAFGEAVDPLLRQELTNLRNAVAYTWEGANRDAFLGENFAWVAGELYPDRRIIVWAHNNHLIEDKWMYVASPDPTIREGLAGWAPADIGNLTYLGHEIRAFAGPKVVSIATLTLGGRFTPDIGPAIYGQEGGLTEVQDVPPAPEGTLEAALLEEPPDVGFLPLRGPGEGVAVVRARALDYTQSAPLLMDWSAGYDGFLYVRETFPLGVSRRVARPDDVP